MPRLNEGDLLVEAVRIPSASLEGAVAASTQIENLLKTIPEVRLVYCKTGRPEIANDVMGVHQTDVWTMLKPQDEWRPGLTRDDLIEEMDKLLVRARPGREVRLQPADRDAGQRAGRRRQERRGRADLRPGPRRAAAGCRWRSSGCCARIPGAHDIKNPTAGRLPMLRIKVRRDQLARYGIKASDVLDAVAALGGTTVGTVFEARQAAPAARPAARVVAQRPREDRLDPGRRPPGAADPAQGPGRRSPRRKGPARSNARTSSTGRSSASTSAAATSPASSPRPRPPSTPQVKFPPGYHVALGRPVRAPADGLPAAC